MSEYRDKKHRLPPERYIGKISISFTLCVDGNRKVFFEQADIYRHVELLTEQLARFDCLAPIYCFMPDHLHVLTFGMSETANGKLAMDAFKLKSGRYLYNSSVGYKWQGDYHDRIVRSEHEWRKKMFYIFNNPVRANIVEDPYDYPLSGSIGFKLEDVIWETGQSKG